MTKLSKIITILCMPTLLCCCKDDELSLSRVPYTGNELRIDGYYYNNIGSLNVHFFYRNGIVRYGGGGYKDFEEFEKCVRNSNIPGNSITDWGVFLINSSDIKFERWYSSSGGGAPAYIREGKILNDTSFHITVSYRSNGSERREIDELYHFREFSPKPDSTNNFIK